MCWIRYGRSLRQNEMKKDKNIILDNFIWRFAERCGAQLVTAVVTLLLARILMPEDYGRTALVFINILQVFIDSGLGTALIQKKDADDLDFSSVFYFNFAVCLVLYAGMFIAAPYIAAFYKDPSLTPVVRVASLTLVFSGVKGIQQAYVSRNMLFKRFFFATLGGTLFSAFLGLGMAYAGFGVGTDAPLRRKPIGRKERRLQTCRSETTSFRTDFCCRSCRYGARQPYR